ncbi:MAG: TIGR04552 family protein [Deltaproteobacteria bacterium]|nr:TIGR04552 family protein [Deltaproteobacteria bacterium]
MAVKDRLKALDEFTLADLEAVRLLLRGDSVIDWHRLNFDGPSEIRDFIVAQEFHPEENADRARMNAIKAEAISYLRRHFEYPIPKPVEQASIEELFELATGRGHRQTCACTILKCMHIIHHLDGRELLFMLPMSDQEIFHLVEEKVYRVIGSMLAEGFPITEFVGGRKNKDSLYTKLLSKREAVSAQIYDKLRFRIVARERDDIFPILQYLQKKLFPFNYVIPNQSINSIFQFKRYCSANDHLKKFLTDMQAGADEDYTPSDNVFSADNYRVIHFVTDMPVRLPRKLLERAPSSAWSLGPVVFVICEFQVIDRETEAANEQGEASHAKYKDRQKKAVIRRLQLGMREMKTPPRREREEPPAPSERERPTRSPGPRSRRG